jgi:FSR family fosmidomycin resistance protein-like MFS transporter
MKLRPDARDWAFMGTITTAHYTHHVITSLLNPMMPSIRDAFGLSYAQTGFLNSAFSLTMGFSNAPMGVLADRYGSRLVISLGLVLTGIAGMGIAMATGYWYLMAVLIGLGIIAGTYHAPAAALIAKQFPSSGRGMAMGLHVTGGNLSFFTSPLLAGALVALTGDWTTPFLWLAIIPIVIGVATWFLSPSVPTSGRSLIECLKIVSEVKSLIKICGPLVSTSILFQMMSVAMISFLALYLVDVRGFETGVAAAMYAVSPFVGLFGAPLGGWLSDRVGRRGVIVAAVALIGPGMLLVTLVPDWLMVMPLALVGLGSSMRMTVTETLVMDASPDGRRGSILGAYHMLSQELGGLMAPLMGLIALWLSLSIAFGAFAVVVAAMSVAVILLRNRL